VKGQDRRQVYWLHCADFILQGEELLPEIRSHLGLCVGTRAGNLSTVWRRYSKNPDRPFTPEDYAARQRDGRRALAGEIDEATGFARQLMRQHAELAELLPYLALPKSVRD
jgi:hypothetical protein